jgi:hypothetical protein
VFALPYVLPSCQQLDLFLLLCIKSVILLDSSDQDGPIHCSLIDCVTRVSPVEFENAKVVIKIYAEVTKK